MINILRNWIFVVMALTMVSCQDDEGPKIPSVEERKAQAIQRLKDDLMAPANGWKVSYRPNETSGAFLILMEFRDNGEVRIRSDVAADGGAYRDQVNTYRIDVGLSLELIFENFGVFHYFFELGQTTFGGEFEFLFSNRVGENLIFTSKSDLGFPTILILEPADGTETSQFGTEAVDNFDLFLGQSPSIFGLKPPSQQIVLLDQGISVFWQIDLIGRSILVDLVGEGTTVAELNNNNNFQALSHFTGYSFTGNTFRLEDELNFQFGGQAYTLQTIDLSNFDPLGGPSLCLLESTPTPTYAGSTSLGNVSIEKSLFSSEGLAFTPRTDNFYGVNSFFIFDDSLRSLQEEGVISVKFPEAGAFLMMYGFENDTLPANAVGLIYEDDQNNDEWILQSFDTTATEINRIEITLREEYYTLGDVDAQEIQDMNEVNSEIFEGGVVYVYDWPNNFGLKIWWMYNPCNEYELLLVD